MMRVGILSGGCETVSVSEHVIAPAQRLYIATRVRDGTINASEEVDDLTSPSCRTGDSDASKTLSDATGPEDICM
jgi:hypothetical protein